MSKQHVRKIVPMIISCMRLWLDDWDFPMQVGLDIGTRWGQTITFDYDSNPFIKIDFNTYNGEKRYRKLSDEEAKKLNIHGIKKYVEDTNGDYIENKNYLSILEPAGEELSEKDYNISTDEHKENNEVIEKEEEQQLAFDTLYTEEEI